MKGGLLTFTLFLLLTVGIDAQALVRKPYLQSATPTAMSVKWRTDVETDSKLWVGTSPTTLDIIITSSTLTIDHELTVSGLDQATKYYYAIGNEQGVMQGGDAQHYITTCPLAGNVDGFTAWILGDSGTGRDIQYAVRDAFYNHPASAETDMILFMGDNAYDDGYDQEYQDFFFDVYAEMIQKTEMKSCPGNHDYSACDVQAGTGPYFDIFNMPQNGELGGLASNTERWFSYDYGNVHFIILDTYGNVDEPGSPQIAWLQDDLAQNDKLWTIALAHAPPYSKGSHNSDTENSMINLRQNMLPILEAAGMDMFLSGHSHTYERSYFINGHYGTSDTFTSDMMVDDGDGKVDGDGAYVKYTTGANGNIGAVYSVVGSSGRMSGGDLDHPVMYSNGLVPGSAILNIKGNELNFQMLDDQGNIFDHFTMIKYEDNDEDGFFTDVDCNDDDSAINPDATEIPNNDIDENCDDEVLVIDEDNDGFNSDDDCNDDDANINPDATEIPNNDIDENCDDEILVIDEDNDGFNSDDDCNDDDADINPDAIEIPNNDVDENCDDEILVIDDDNDGFNSDEDCDDDDAAINPDATEIPNNGIDEDCDGEDLVSTVINENVETAINIYPNPVSDALFFEIPENVTYQVLIYDILGMVKKNMVVKNNTGILDVNQLESGFYKVVFYGASGEVEKGFSLVKL